MVFQAQIEQEVRHLIAVADRAGRRGGEGLLHVLADAGALEVERDGVGLILFFGVLVRGDLDGFLGDLILVALGAGHGDGPVVLGRSAAGGQQQSRRAQKRQDHSFFHTQDPPFK